MVVFFRKAGALLCAVSLWVATTAVAAEPSDAQQALASAYRGNPSPQLLLQLAHAAHKKGRTLEARDLARRVLADPTANFSGEDKAQIEALAALPIAHFGEMLVQGQNGAFVSVDGRLRGVLPLLLPLLVEAGRHEVLLDFRARRVRTQVEIPDGRLIEVRYASGSDAVAITTPPPILLLARARGAPLPAAALAFIDKSLRRANLARAAIEDPPRKPLGGAGCIDSLKCQLELGAREKVELVLALRLEQRDGTKAVTYELVDVGVGDVASQAEVSCSSCDLQTLLQQLSESLNLKLLEGSTRARGEIDIKSTPPGAEVRRGAIVLGTTPLHRSAWVGAQKLKLARSGYRDTPLALEVRDGQTASATVTLEPDASGFFGALGRRPRWRLGVGGAALTVGGFMLGIGIAALAVNGHCVDEPVPPAINCDRNYATLAPGIGLTMVGPLLMIGGAALIAVSPR